MHASHTNITCIQSQCGSHNIYPTPSHPVLGLSLRVYVMIVDVSSSCNPRLHSLWLIPRMSDLSRLLLNITTETWRSSPPVKVWQHGTSVVARFKFTFWVTQNQKLCYTVHISIIIGNLFLNWQEYDIFLKLSCLHVLCEEKSQPHFHIHQDFGSLIGTEIDRIYSYDK